MKKILDIIVKERMQLKKDRIRNGAIIGSMVGLSVGMLVASNMKNDPRRKIMKTARKEKSTLVNGISSMLG